MKLDKHRSQPSYAAPGKWKYLLLALAIALALVAPYVTALGGEQKQQALGVSSNVSTTITVNADEGAKQVTSLGGLQTSKPAASGLQARVASNYLASRAASGLQLKRSAPKTKNTSSALGDSVGLETALDSQMDLETAAGEHKKYILVKKKPKHKKIKMEVYKPKMKYKKIKMKVPVKKMKKKKVKGYLVKKEKHSY